MALLSTIRVAIRTLARRPAITLVAALSLAVGIGVNTAVFSLVDLMFLRPPAVRDPYSLVHIMGSFKDSGPAILDWSDCLSIEQETPAFSAATAYMERGGVWRNGGDAVLVPVTVVADNYFEMLGVRPALGRLPEKGHNYHRDSEPPVILSDWFWRERMGARRDIIGSRMELTGRLFRVVAILPREFRGLYASSSRPVWMPVGSWTRNASNDLQRGGGQFESLARLKPGGSLDQAQAQLDTLAKRIEASDARVPKGRRLVATALGKQLRSRVLPGVFVMAVVALVLLVACANVATALLAYAEARRREIAMRLALGAGRAALLVQFAAESAVLACAGAGLGLLVGRWLIALAPALFPPSQVPISFDLRMDAKLLAFTAGATLVTLAIFGLAPLAYSLRVSLLDAMAGARTAGRTRRSWTRIAFVSAQVALSVVVVTGAVVLIRALADTRAIYPGYDSARPLALLFANLQSNVPEVNAYRSAAERVSEIGGVQDVTYARHLPLVDSGSGATMSVVPQGAPADAVPKRIYFNLVGPRFFEVTGSRVIRGRIFTDSDHHAGTSAAIVNGEAARRFWPGEDPIGKTLKVRDRGYQVVGIAADARISNLHGSVDPMLFLPASAMQWGETILIAHTKADPASMLKELSNAAGKTGELRIYESMTLRMLMRQALYSDWMPSVLGGGLAVVGLLLAAGGLYGAVSYSAQRRLGEFGVRLALGARPREIGALVVRQGAILCLLGVPAGCALFAAVYRYYGATLLQNRPFDPASLLVGAIVTVLVVLAGATLPAIRASRLDPNEILRAE